MSSPRRIPFFPVVLAVIFLMHSLVALPAAAQQPSLTIGYGSSPDFGDVPSLMAADRLRAQGYTVNTVFFAQPELLGQALLGGEIDLAGGPIATAFQANRQNPSIKLIANMSGNEWSLVTVREIQSCRDMVGRRFAIHSPVGLSVAMIRNWLAENSCPEPNFVVIPGSDVRAQALLAGQIEGAPVELADALYIEEARPGAFHRIANFSRDLPHLLANAYYTSERAIQRNRKALEDFLAAVITIHREIVADPDLAVKAAKRYLPDVDEQVLPRISRAWSEGGLWPLNGDMTEESISYSIRFYADGGIIRPGLDPSQTADLSLLANVLDTIGVVE